MKKIKFKLVPFIISLAIVLGSVAGITLYSYFEYDNNKLRFVADYFHYEDYKSVETTTQIDNFIDMTTYAHQNIKDGLKFYDASSKKEYTNIASDNSKNLINGATWENGVLHLPGYFDLKFYAETLYNTEDEKWVFSYYIYLFNVNYETKDIIEHLYFSFVDGTGESPEGELYGTTKLDTIIDEFKDGKNGGANAINLPSFQYTGNNSSSYTMYIHDNNSINHNLTDDTPYVYRLTALNETLSESSDLDDHIEERRWFSELESTTFSIFYSGSNALSDAISNGTTNEIKEIVRGTYVNPYKNAEAFNQLAEENTNDISLGYSKNLYKAGYFKFIIGRIVIEGLITFVISGILAILFYLIWQDDEEEPKAKVKIIKK